MADELKQKPDENLDARVKMLVIRQVLRKQGPDSLATLAEEVLEYLRKMGK